MTTWAHRQPLSDLCAGGAAGAAHDAMRASECRAGVAEAARCVAYTVRSIRRWLLAGVRASIPSMLQIGSPAPTVAPPHARHCHLPHVTVIWFTAVNSKYRYERSVARIGYMPFLKYIIIIITLSLTMIDVLYCLLVLLMVMADAIPVVASTR